jgi:N12 class adenine-specific DNA methylase
MAVLNYTYLKMKMPGPKGVITVGSSIEHAFDYDVECVEHTEALALDEALIASMEKLVNEDLDSKPSMSAASRLPSRPRRCPSTLLIPRARR